MLYQLISKHQRGRPKQRSKDCIKMDLIGLRLDGGLKYVNSDWWCARPFIIITKVEMHKNILNSIVLF